jgi:glycerol-3-phosphate dehydrogenase (NAD(P)+)
MLEASAVAKIAVVGAGMMGSATCVPLADRGHTVHLVGTPLDDAVVAALRATGRHPTLGVDLPSAVQFHDVGELDRVLEHADAIALGVSSAGVGWAARALSPALRRRQRPVLMVSKGLTFGDAGLRVLTDVFDAQVPGAAGSVSICGPCIAGELARRVPTMAVLTGRDGELARRFAGWLETPYYRPRVSDDVIGVQVCAALKNAYALGVSLAAGLHEGAGGERGSVAMHNYEAAVFAQAISEMQSWVARLGGDERTVVGLAGTGDLNVTCNGGRTGRFGVLLGRGHTARQARELMAGVTLECLEVLAVLERCMAAHGSPTHEQVPLLSHLIEVALHEAPLAMPFERFFLA